MRISDPGLFSTRSEMSCSIYGSDLHRLRRSQDHFVDRTAGRDHWVDILERRYPHVQKIRAGLAHRFFERWNKLMHGVNGAALEAISAGQLLDIRERAQLHLAEPIVVKKLLPLPDHAEMPVVHHDDLDGQRVIGDGG